MIRHPVTATAALLALGLVCRGAQADGGAVRFDGQCGGYRIVAFTQPTPLRAGIVDLSVLVQRAGTDEALPDTSVTIALSQQAGGFHQERPATYAAATNKMLRATRFMLPKGGAYDVRIVVDGPAGTAAARFALDVSPALPRWRAEWPWLFWPIIPIGLYVWQALARARQQGRRGRVGVHVSEVGLRISGRSP